VADENGSLALIQEAEITDIRRRILGFIELSQPCAAGDLIAIPVDQN